MQFSAILTSLALAGCAMSTFALPALAQGRDGSREAARADDTLMDMSQAYKQRDRKRLSAQAASPETGSAATARPYSGKV